MKLNTRAFSLAGAFVLGLSMFLSAWWVMAFEGDTGATMPLASIFRGFTISPGGSVIGLVWGLVGGAVAGAVFSALYNGFAGYRTPRFEKPVEREAARPYEEIRR